ncbi:hypothetical protein CPB84DRAFT_1854548 [Gymnopilus junonius]|uniref:Uncharacterized protein n=1 Tax=Gymnopilus junonius TaxID=109634 RepID=A0A9P5N7L1_GYMJU|nr:hypothetical protein CPB84DRAFT_1854548 [Gymnopilus junonius]
MAEADTPCPINSEASRDAVETIRNDFPSAAVLVHSSLFPPFPPTVNASPTVNTPLPPSGSLSTTHPTVNPPHCQQPHPHCRVSMPIEHPRDPAQAVSGEVANTHESTTEPQHGQQPQADNIGANTPPPEVPKMWQMKPAPGPNDEEDGGSEGFTESEADGSDESSKDGAHAPPRSSHRKGSSRWKERESREEVRSDDDDDDDEGAPPMNTTPIATPAHDEKHPPVSQHQHPTTGTHCPSRTST